MQTQYASRPSQARSLAETRLRNCGETLAQIADEDPPPCEAWWESDPVLRFLEASGIFSFKGLRGLWLVVFNGRCGVLLDPGMANMWRRGGEQRHNSPDGRSFVVVGPCANRGLEVGFFLLFRFMVRFRVWVLTTNDTRYFIFFFFWGGGGGGLKFIPSEIGFRGVVKETILGTH